ncbi:MarR family winged helix-turn-helix transcriptional regulator [Methylobacterium sp. J-090]|uniref:MarR family winged helix-turn-helix transcriptional regulator n=1 Tax=Methylobacterium sp. J-090 TaxID=2836666 RepID=UPI001FB876B6|nr:MarR family transcriptional regulator [Methylobacterium sp. J-090]MCJ2081988.1 MarR family transcriptional regulator [Methylobacterium sp. J-090]
MILPATPTAGGDASVPSQSPPAQSPGDDLIELLFFAYRDFVGDPDRILAQYGFGRAHHRVLHFVDRYPGLTIAELLDILRITKQSLNRVLKDLIEQDYIVQKTGTSDRRQRLLFCTARGTALAGDLIRVQTHRVTRALAEPAGAASEGGSSEGGAVSAQNFLLAMIEPEERATVRRLMARRARSAV